MFSAPSASPRSAFALGGGGGDSHMEQTGMLIPALGVAKAFCNP